MVCRSVAQTPLPHPQSYKAEVMKSMLRFSSLIALGLITASAIAIIAAGSMSRVPIETAGGAVLDFRSVLIGLVVGLWLSWLTRVSWAELPRRLVAWIWANERNFYRAAIAVLLLAVLIFY